MLTSAFKDAVLSEPLSQGCDSLYILTAHATPEMIAWTIKTFNETTHSLISIFLLIGMAAEGISERAHNEFVRLHGRRFGNTYFECSYIDRVPYCHTNLYLWKQADTPMKAFVGTAEFAQSYILFPVRKEAMNECCPEEANNYIINEFNRSVYCNHNEVRESIRIVTKTTLFDLDILTNANTVIISLLTNKGIVAETSGLNWGQRKGRNPNQAYIRLPSKISRTGFFPFDRPFTVLTDDGKEMILRVEQEGNKAITTPDSNALIGEYFRNRLGVPNGAMITVEHLVDYGRSNVAFSRIDDETYYMDFCQPLR